MSEILKVCETFLSLLYTTVFSILTIRLSLLNENEKLFYQNNQRKKLYNVQYESKFCEYSYYLFMRKNKNVHAFFKLHCNKLQNMGVAKMIDPPLCPHKNFISYF